MQKLNVLLEATKLEEAENRKKLVHNIICDVENCKPYDNKAFIEYIEYVNNNLLNKIMV